MKTSKKPALEIKVLPAQAALRLRGLYAITPDCADTEQLFAQVQAALAGGCRVMQYRDKLADAATRHFRARQIQQYCQASGATFIVNDDLVLALDIHADGVHLGGDDGDLAYARPALGPGRILGASCYNDLAQAERAAAAGADYVAFGAVFTSATKPDAKVAPLELFQAWHLKSLIPVCAIGGISLENAPEVIAAGADMVAVITDLFASPNITARAADFQRLFQDISR